MDDPTASDRPTAVPRAGSPETWLASTIEDVVDPDLKICDAHHHLWDHKASTYLIDDLHADTGDGHRVATTIFIECGSEYRKDGPVELRSAGEVAFVARQAELSRVADGAEIRGIISHADATLGADINPVLDLHVELGDGRFRGIRHAAAWDASPLIKQGHSAPPPELLRRDDVRAAVKALGKRGLVFEAWVFWPQVADVIDLARACPNTIIVLDHLGGPIGIGPYKDQRSTVIASLRQQLVELAECPNVVVKLGGIGMSIYGDGWHRGETAPTSDQVEAVWGEQIRWTVEQFGAERCLFESNFPMDRVGMSYRVLWNAFKKSVAHASEGERELLFHDTATRVYRLDDDF